MPASHQQAGSTLTTDRHARMICSEVSLLSEVQRKAAVRGFEYAASGDRPHFARAGHLVTDPFVFIVYGLADQFSFP